MSPADSPIRLEITPSDNIARLVFDRPNSSANIFDEPTIRALDQCLTKLETRNDIKGLVISSAKKSIFIAGADLKSLVKKSYDNSLGDFIAYGQSLFNRIAQLPFPTVAAIHGATAGGGYELTLACDWRIATSSPATKIGLPEVTLGLLPAWGGATRLPRLIGLEKAASVVLQGKLYSAQNALESGLVDELVPETDLFTKALSKINQGKPSRKTPDTKKAEAPDLLKSASTDYPASKRAWQVMQEGLTQTLENSLKLEKEAIVELVETETCRNLIRNFFLFDRARKATASKEPKPFESVGVVGAGVMGTGIAYWLSSRNFKVVLYDSNQNALEQSLKSISELYKHSAESGYLTKEKAQQNVQLLSKAENTQGLKDCDLVIEAASEKISIKKEIFKSLDASCKPSAILATNTSALSVTEVASAITSPDRVIGLHFFNPAHKMKLLEVVTTKNSSNANITRILEFAGQIAKIPVVVTDSPGFIVNRCLFPYLLEAAELFQRGVELEEIEKAALDFGMPLGPLRLIDSIGLDVSLDIAETLGHHFPGYITVPHIIRRLIDNGHLGQKKAGGFYRYDTGNPRPNPSAISSATKEKQIKISSKDLQLRLFAPMLNESIRCLEEKVSEKPGDIDLAMMLGTGFPAHCGGPIRYAEHYGLPKLVAAMNTLASSVHVRFAPCRLLQEKAKTKQNFYEDIV